MTEFHVMTRIIAAIVMFCLLLPASGRAQGHPAGVLNGADRMAIRQVIKAQLSALQHDDGARAFSYATPLLQLKFRTPENFLSMVKIAYPSVYRPRETQFRELKVTAGTPVQKVFFIGPTGEPVLGLYPMQRQPDGSWKINGCTLAPAPDISI
jgi:Domain of unknown function (DUF4864)